MTRAGLLERTSASLADRWDRRGFLGKAALVGSALLVNPVQYLLRPISAQAAVCNCRGQGCACGSRCCEGWTEFCCTLTGQNTCPPGSIAAGWWKSDGSRFCDGPRYYVDCNAVCQCEGGGSFCAGCDGQTCGCANGDCANWGSGCVVFRYGQCSQDVARVGRIVCRVASCTPPYLFEPSCTATSATNNGTAHHSRPCEQAQDPGAILPLAETAAFASSPDAGGYWIIDAPGGVFTFGTVPYLGSVTELRNAGTVAPVGIVAAAATASGRGYWLTDGAGGVFTFGDAGFFGSVGDLPFAVTPIVAFSPTPSGRGYWLVDRRGGVFTFGDAAFLGSVPDLRARGLAGSADAVAFAATPGGGGYWVADRAGGVFAFGDAGFFGSVAALRAVGAVGSAEIVAIVGTPSGRGYWLADRTGGVFAFGDAEFLGSQAALRQQGQAGVADIVAMAATSSGRGYWVLDRSGGVFAFGDAPYRGSMPELRAAMRG